MIPRFSCALNRVGKFFPTLSRMNFRLAQTLLRFLLQLRQNLHRDSRAQSAASPKTGGRCVGSILSFRHRQRFLGPSQRPASYLLATVDVRRAIVAKLA